MTYEPEDPVMYSLSATVTEQSPTLFGEGRGEEGGRKRRGEERRGEERREEERTGEK